MSRLSRSHFNTFHILIVLCNFLDRKLHIVWLKFFFYTFAARAIRAHATSNFIFIYFVVCVLAGAPPFVTINCDFVESAAITLGSCAVRVALSHGKFTN